MEDDDFLSADQMGDRCSTVYYTLINLHVNQMQRHFSTKSPYNVGDIIYLQHLEWQAFLPKNNSRRVMNIDLEAQLVSEACAFIGRLTRLCIVHALPE